MSTASLELSSLSDPSSSPLLDLLSSPALYSFIQTLANNDNIDKEINSPLYQSNLADRDRINTTQKLEEGFSPPQLPLREPGAIYSGRRPGL